MTFLWIAVSLWEVLGNMQVHFRWQEKSDST
jgi:hypothetical protein